MKIRIRCLLVALFAVFVVQEGWAAEKKILTMVGPVFPPYYFIDNKGEANGVLCTLYRMIVENAGYGWKGTIVPAKRVMVSLNRGQYDSSILVNNPILRESENILASERPVSQMVLNAYHLEKFPKLNSKKDLLGKRVVVMRGYGYGGFRKWLDDLGQTVKLYEVNSFESAIKLIEIGRADYALLYDVNFHAGESSLGRKAKNIVASNVSNVPLYLQINHRVVENAPAVMAELLASYDELMKNGKISAALARPELAIIGRPTND